MATFSTNQVKQFYVAKAVDSSLDTIGDIKFGKTADGELFAKYVGNDGVVRTDLIPLDKIIYAKATKASAMAQSPKTVYVGSTSAVAGQDYILKVTINEFGGISPDDKGFIFADYRAKSGDAGKNVLANLAVCLAKNASVAAYNELIKVYVTTAAVGSIAAGNCTLVTADTDVTSLSGSYVGIVIEGAEQPWTLGKQSFDKVDFTVAADSIVASGIETEWATISDASIHIGGDVNNSKMIADLEYFCAGERGDMYRGIGFPNNFEFKPLVNPAATYGYDIINIAFYYSGDAEDIQRSTKELVLAIPAPSSYGSSTASYLVTADINTAAGSTVVTQVFGS